MKIPVHTAMNALLAALTLTLFSCGPEFFQKKGPESVDFSVFSSKTVHIDESPVKNQRAIGFCWAYSFVGLIESLELKKGHEVDLSEEYLGYHHMYSQVQKALNSPKPSEMITTISEGNITHLTLELAERVGLVPESVFNIKYDKEGVEKKLVDFFQKAFSDPDKVERYKADEELLLSDFAFFFGKRAPKPDDKFIYSDGLEYTPLTFAKNKLGHQLDDYRFFEMNSAVPGSLEHGIYLMKVALMNKVSVPVGFPTFGGSAQVDGVWDTKVCRSWGCQRVSGHAMLVVDFMTDNGRFGEMPIEEAKAVFHNPLVGVIVKNSWGTERGLNQEGENATVGKGYDIITKDYFIDSLIANNAWGMTITLPKTIYDETGNAFYGAGLFGMISSNEYYEKGKKVSFKFTPFDIPEGSSGDDLHFDWTIKNLNNPTEIIFNSESGNPGQLEYKFKKTGAYEVSVLVNIDGAQKLFSKRVWIGEKYRKLINENFILKTVNGPWINWGDSTLVFDTRESQKVPGFNRLIVDLPDVDFIKNGKINFLYSVEGEGITPELELSTDGNKYEQVFCLHEENEEEKVTKYNCQYPEKGGFDGDSKVRFRFVANQMPQEEHKNRGILYVKKLKFSVSNSGINDAPGPNYIISEYPKDVDYKRFTATGKPVVFRGFFGKDVEKIKAWVGDQSFNVTDIEEVDEEVVMATFSFTPGPGQQGFYPVRLAAVSNGVESSYLQYELYVMPPANSLIDGGVWKGDIENFESWFIKNSEGWSFIKYGLAAAPYPTPILNDLSITGGFALDLSKKSTPSTLKLKIFHNLEENYDFLFVKVSLDGGASFITSATVTGAHSGPKDMSIDLTPYNGRDNVVIRFDVVSDSGKPSAWLILNEIVVE